MDNEIHILFGYNSRYNSIQNRNSTKSTHTQTLGTLLRSSPAKEGYQLKERRDVPAIMAKTVDNLFVKFLFNIFVLLTGLQWLNGTDFSLK